jgi:hypothetical protein
MAFDLAARLREYESAEMPVFFTPVTTTHRRHVINRSTQEKSGRLYFYEDWDFDIPSLEIYAAR